MENKEYNGWTNYETWLVHLWLSNDEGSYNWARELAKELEGTMNQYGNERDDAFEEQLVELYLDPPENGLKADMLNAAISKVNWREVREAFLEE